MRDIFLEETQARIEESAEKAKSNIEQRLPKKFYKDVSVELRDGDHVLLLDGRGAKTPSRKPISLPHGELAESVAQEWRDQDELIDPRTMPLTRLVSAAIEGGQKSLDGQRDEILRYAGNDVLCYRASHPDELIARQVECWDPVLDHFTTAHGMKFVLTQAILHVEQPKANDAKMSDILAGFDLFGLTAVSSLMNLCGSALLPIAMAQGVISASQTWDAAHIEEDWNIGQWGSDSEAQERREMRRKEFDAGVSVLGFLHPRD